MRHVRRRTAGGGVPDVGGDEEARVWFRRHDGKWEEMFVVRPSIVREAGMGLWSAPPTQTLACPCGEVDTVLCMCVPSWLRLAVACPSIIQPNLT